MQTDQALSSALRSRYLVGKFRVGNLFRSTRRCDAQARV